MGPGSVFLDPPQVRQIRVDGDGLALTATPGWWLEMTFQLPAKKVRSLRVALDEGKGPGAVTLTLDADRYYILHIGVRDLDQRDEALDIAWRMGKILDLRAYREEEDDGLAEVVLEREERVPDGGPFRVSEKERFRQVPDRLGKAEYGEAEPKRGFREPQVRAVPPFDPEEATSDAKWRVETWEPGERVTTERPGLGAAKWLWDRPLRLILLLAFMGPAATIGVLLILSIIVWPLFYLLAWMSSVVAGVESEVRSVLTGVSGVLGIMGGLGLWGSSLAEHDPLRVEIDWGQKRVGIRSRKHNREVRFDEIRAVKLKGGETGWRVLLCLPLQDEVLFAWKNAQHAASMAVDLARALDVPFRTTHTEQGD